MTLQEAHEWLLKAGIVTVCVEMRMSMEGSADPMPIGDMGSVLFALEQRLAEWDKRTGSRSKEFDDAIKRVVEISTRDIRAEFERRAFNRLEA